MFEFSGGENFYERPMNVVHPMNNETFIVQLFLVSRIGIDLGHIFLGFAFESLPDMTCRER